MEGCPLVCLIYKRPSVKNLQLKNYVRRRSFETFQAGTSG